MPTATRIGPMPHRQLHSPEIQENFEFLEDVQLGSTENSVAMAYRNAAQKIKTTEFVQVKLDKAINDPGGNLDLTNGYYVVPQDGYYLVVGQISLKTNVAEYDVLATIIVNGVEKCRGVQQEKLGGGIVGCTTSGIVSCKKGEHIELHIYQASGVEKELEVFGEPG